MTKAVFLALLALSFPRISPAIPLSENSIREAKKIVVVTGDFDPWSNADAEYVEKIIRSGEADLVVVSPNASVKKNVPLSVENRVLLLETALKNHPSIAYPEGSEDVLEKIKKISGNKVSVRRAPVPNVDIRTFLLQNSDQYIQRTPGIAPSGFSPEVYERVLQNGFYMGHRPGAASSPLLSAVRVTTEKMGISNYLMHMYKSIISRPNLRSFEADGKTYPISKFLGAGAQGDAYLSEIDGKRVVLKVAKGSESSRNVMLDSVMTHQWLTKTSSISLPEVLATDPEGKWISMNFVEGTQLDKYIAANGGEIPAALEDKLHAFYDEAYRVYRRNGITLDINTQNIFVGPGGKLTLVDFGTLQPGRKLFASYAEARAFWVDDSRRLLPKASQPLNAACVKSKLNLLRN